MLDKKYFEKGYRDLQFHCGGDDGLKFSFSFEDLTKMKFKTKKGLCKFLENIITDYWNLIKGNAYEYGNNPDKTDFEVLLCLYSLLEYYKDEGEFQ